MDDVELDGGIYISVVVVLTGRRILAMLVLTASIILML